MARWLPLHQSVSVIRLNCSSVETEEGGGGTHYNDEAEMDF
jgi:hypothetical protein